MALPPPILETKEQVMLAQLQYRLDSLVEATKNAQQATTDCLGSLIGAMNALTTEIARPKHRTVIYDADGNIIGSEET